MLKKVLDECPVLTSPAYWDCGATILAAAVQHSPSLPPKLLSAFVAWFLPGPLEQAQLCQVLLTPAAI